MSYVRNCWYIAGFADEATQQPFARTFLETSVVIYRGESGEPVALDNNCPHRFAPMDQGKVFGNLIQCPYHGLRFNGQGNCVSMPIGGEPPPRARLRAYPIAERHQLLWIWMGAAQAADPALIPDYAYLEDPGFGWFNGYLHVKGNYQLLVDNLLDLTHAEFMHPLLTSDGWSGRNEQTVTQDGDTIFISNLAHDDNILPIMRQMRPDLEPIGTTRVDERWDLPSLIRLSVEYYAGGKQIITPSGHFLTPETASTTHYFVRGGQDVAPDNPAVTAGTREGVLHVFRTEDVPMIEAQQRYLKGDDLLSREPAILRTDSGAIRARRLVAKKIRTEQDDAAGAIAAE
jgi:phenylpropionate dioxygenase-like ring-hydroxylating dioxygenase large terminal subunit